MIIKLTTCLILGIKPQQMQSSTYFDKMTEDAVFIGTDATENWGKPDFQEFAKPYFDKGKAWNFTVLERHIYFDQSKKTAWFDELLNTQKNMPRFWSGENRRQMENQTLCFIDDDSE
jgi:hypothetical protein